MSLLFVPRPRADQIDESPCHYDVQDEEEYTPLTCDALKTLALSLPQPISTVRYSNKKNQYLFSDRESVCCPSLSSSPVSATSSTRVSRIHSTDDHPVLIAPSGVSPEDYRRHHQTHHITTPAPPPAAKQIPKGGLDFDSLFDIDCGGFRRDSTIDFLPDFDEIDDYVPDERTAARLEEERELEKARLLYEKELDDDYPVTVSRKPIMPTSLWISQPRHIMTPNFVPSPQITELTIPVSSSSIEASETSEFFPKSSSSSSLDTSSTTSTELTVPSIDGMSEVDDELVSTVFTFLSLNHNSMAKKFDAELAMGAGMSVGDVSFNRKEALKKYIEKYVFSHPEVEI